jgi:molybdopterin biosynthesis enzyme
MNNNVISFDILHKVEMQTGGVLAIIGDNSGSRLNGSVVFMVSGLPFCGTNGIESFAKAVTPMMKSSDNRWVVIFTYDMPERLRDPQGLLKSVRNRIMRAIKEIRSESDAEQGRMHREWITKIAADHFCPESD